VALLASGQEAMVPDGWQLPPPDLVVYAKRKAIEALGTDGQHAAKTGWFASITPKVTTQEPALLNSARSPLWTSPLPICSRLCC
jgi:hypothetical protein